MSLSYFEDAEKQMMPKMYVSVSWEEMKAYIIKEVEKISQLFNSLLLPDWAKRLKLGFTWLT